LNNKTLHELLDLVRDAGWSGEAFGWLFYEFLTETNNIELLERFLTFCIDLQEEAREPTTNIQFQTLLTSLLGEEAPTLNEIEDWTPAQKDEVDRWTASVIQEMVGMSVPEKPIRPSFL